MDSAALPILPGPTTLRSVNGTATPASATVCALQACAGGPTIEAAWAPVGENSGAFGFALPIGAPVKRACVANPSALTFSPDATAAAKCSVEATSNGATRAQAVDTNAAVPPLLFRFP